MGLFGLYILLSALGLSVIGGKVLADSYPEFAMEEVGLAFINYAFIYSFFFRMMMQTFPSLQLTPYLLLPIRKSKIVNHLLIRSLFSYYNLLPLVLMIPFALIFIRPEVSGSQFTSIFVFIIGFILLNHFLVFFLSKAATFKRRWIMLIFPILAGLIWLDYKGYIELVQMFVSLSKIILSKPIWCVVPLILCGAIIYNLRKGFFRQYGLIDSSNQGVETAKQYHLAWLDKYGTVGALLDLEFRLILRSKRAKSYLYMSVLMMLYPFILLTDSETDFKPIIIAMSLFVSGAFSLNYGLLLLSWNSLHFDLLLTRVVRYEDIFKAKFYLLAGSTFILTLVSFPYLFWSVKFYMYILCTSLYCMSIIPALYMWIANYKSLRIDPHTGGAFSFNGFGATHWLAMVPIMVIPILLFYLGYSLGGENLGLAIVAVVGLIGIIMHRSIINWNAEIFQKQKYQLSESFKKQE